MSGTQGKRPWLAALLGTLATGLGHFYLRRWGRGLGWFVLAVLVSLFFVPADAAQALLDGGGDPVTLLPVFAVGIASVVDAYLLARRTRSARTAATAGSGVGDAEPEGSEVTLEDRPQPAAGAADPAGVDDGEACPNCGKDLDPDLDFCPWCTARLE